MWSSSTSALLFFCKWGTLELQVITSTYHQPEWVGIIGEGEEITRVWWRGMMGVVVDRGVWGWMLSERACSRLPATRSCVRGTQHLCLAHPADNWGSRLMENTSKWETDSRLEMPVCVLGNYSCLSNIIFRVKLNWFSKIVHIFFFFFGFVVEVIIGDRGLVIQVESFKNIQFQSENFWWLLLIISFIAYAFFLVLMMLKERRDFSGTAAHPGPSKVTSRDEKPSRWLSLEL